MSADAPGPIGRPFVVAHLAVSVDGSTTGFEPDVGRFYELAGTWNEDVTLVGADTILAQEQSLAAAPRPGPAEAGPLLAVVDSKARVRQWQILREVGYWSDVLALRAEATPPRPAHPPVREAVVGTDRVDLVGALTVLGEREGARVIRVDSGGSLIRALLSGGLLDEVSLLIHPCLVGTEGSHPLCGSILRPAQSLELESSRTMGDGLVWARYRLE